MSKNNTGYYFYSKTQENIMRDIEGINFRCKYIIINGKKINYTEHVKDNKPTFPDAKLVASGYDKDIKGE